MDRSSIYYRQVQLLLQVMPLVAKHECFALKGGSAINLFVRNLPRLSVDIDLVFLPLMPRGESLKMIRANLSALGDAIESELAGAQIVKSFETKDDALRMVVKRHGVQIKIELSPVLRGTVFAPEVTAVCDAVEEEFGFAEILVVAHADLYAGKICAALDRQHPRDLFDVKWLLDNEGLTTRIRKTFLVYLISHRRPIAELLRPRYADLSRAFHGEFADMTEVAVSLDDLEATRERLVAHIHESLTLEERQFLLGFKNRNADWGLLGLDRVDRLPAVRWKQENLARMSEDKHAAAYSNLRQVLQKGYGPTLLVKRYETRDTDTH